MRPLPLPDVTLIAIDCVAHALTRCAVEDTQKQIDAQQVLLWSDRAIDLRTSYAYQIFSADCRSRCDTDAILWYEAPTRVTTSHVMLIQYDGWVLDASRWRPEFLEYDYIGAPWPWHPNRRVGNGGFSLRSTKLLHFLREHMDEFPLRYDLPEDDLLCRVYRPALEAHGFRWAPEKLAREFSFERDTPRPAFGFHGIFNLAHVLSLDRLAERMALANDYVRHKSEWRELEMAAV